MMSNRQKPNQLMIVVALVLSLGGRTVCAETPAASPGNGAIIYRDFCASCHGDHLRNPSSGATYDLRRLKPEDHDRFVNSVLNGKGNMPPWRGALDEDQIEAIWAYIRGSLDR